MLDASCEDLYCYNEENRGIQCVAQSKSIQAVQNRSRVEAVISTLQMFSDFRAQRFGN